MKKKSVKIKLNQSKQNSKSSQKEIETRLSPELFLELKRDLPAKRLAKTHIFLEKFSYEGIPTDLKHIVALHRSVLDRALVDMFSPYSYVRDDVFDWLDLENDAFVYSCERAGIPAETVYVVFKEIQNFVKRP